MPSDAATCRVCEVKHFGSCDPDDIRAAKARLGQPRKKPRNGARIPEAVIRIVKERSKGRCEIKGPHCTGIGQELSHVQHKGMGGRKGLDKLAIDSAANLEMACRVCHAEMKHHLKIGGIDD